jgi:hypothetical protein
MKLGTLQENDTPKQIIITANPAVRTPTAKEIVTVNKNASGPSPSVMNDNAIVSTSNPVKLYKSVIDTLNDRVSYVHDKDNPIPDNSLGHTSHGQKRYLLSDNPTKEVLDESKLENLVEHQYCIPRLNSMQVLNLIVSLCNFLCVTDSCADITVMLHTLLLCLLGSIVNHSDRPSFSPSPHLTLLEGEKGPIKHAKFRLNNTVSSWLNPLLTFDPGGLFESTHPKAYIEHSTQTPKFSLHSPSTVTMSSDTLVRGAGEHGEHICKLKRKTKDICLVLRKQLQPLVCITLHITVMLWREDIITCPRANHGRSSSSACHGEGSVRTKGECQKSNDCETRSVRR